MADLSWQGEQVPGVAAIVAYCDPACPAIVASYPQQAFGTLI
jgi:hypothetical protein